MRSPLVALFVLSSLGWAAASPANRLATWAADVPKRPALADAFDPIAMLESADKAKRLEATRIVLEQDRKMLEPLEKAGAKNAALAESAPARRRLDMVYTLIVGLPSKSRVYAPTSFAVYVEKGVTSEALEEMGKKHGFRLMGEFAPDASPSCWVQITRGSIASVMRDLLMQEANIKTVALNYVEHSTAAR